MKADRPEVRYVYPCGCRWRGEGTPPDECFRHGVPPLKLTVTYSVGGRERRPSMCPVGGLEGTVEDALEAIRRMLGEVIE